MIIYSFDIAQTTYYSLDEPKRHSSNPLECSITRDELDALVPLCSDISSLLGHIYRAQASKNRVMKYADDVYSLRNMVGGNFDIKV